MPAPSGNVTLACLVVTTLTIRDF